MVAQNKLVLVNPVNKVRSGFSVNQSSRFPPLGLGILSGLTPESWHVELVDENSAPFAYRDADLVGITAFTSAANRAHEIADIYRSRGVPVVMGGIHASTCTDEALRFADAVVVGEAESVWQQVLDEMETIPDELLFFVDDNIIGYGSESRAQVLAIFKGMVERGINKRWFCQASVNVADDPEVLDWAARAGCKMIFLGIEAEDVDALTEVNKRLNLKRGLASYTKTVDRLHEAGIAVLGAFIFGMDGDTPAKLRRRTDFMINSGVDVMQTTIMTPLPGTQLFRRLQQEGRLLFTNFPQDWCHYDLTDLVHQPKDCARDELRDVILDFVREIYSLPVLKAKAKRTLDVTGDWAAMEFAYQANMNYRNICLEHGSIA